MVEVRCNKCGKLLFKINLTKDKINIEIKCNRCKFNNNIYLYN